MIVMIMKYLNGFLILFHNSTALEGPWLPLNEDFFHLVEFNYIFSETVNLAYMKFTHYREGV